MSAATDEERMAAHRRAQQPAGGTCTDADLAGLRLCWRRGEPTADQVTRVRQLLAESPLRDMASAAIEGRDWGRGQDRDSSGRTGARKPAADRGATYPAARRVGGREAV